MHSSALVRSNRVGLFENARDYICLNMLFRLSDLVRALKELKIKLKFFLVLYQGYFVLQ